MIMPTISQPVEQAKRPSNHAIGELRTLERPRGGYLAKDLQGESAHEERHGERSHEECSNVSVHCHSLVRRKCPVSVNPDQDENGCEVMERNQLPAPNISVRIDELRGVLVGRVAFDERDTPLCCRLWDEPLFPCKS